MAYEEMKRWGFEQKRKRFARAGKTMTPEDDKLVRITRTDTALLDLLVPSHTVEYGLYRHVGRKQVVCALDDVPIPSHSFAPTSRTCFFLSVQRVSHILALHRTTPPRTYTLISPPPSNEHGKAKAFKVSTAASEQTLFASFLVHVSRLLCTKIWRGCSVRPLSDGSKGARQVDCHSPLRAEHVGRNDIVFPTIHFYFAYRHHCILHGHN